MTKIALRVENLGKKYRKGKASQYFREQLKSVFTRREMEANEFWALKDLNFEIKQGEAVGIIGRNGAGKSTLLKILSRITHPTTGMFELNGRVSSLLEVGTGFHMELSGRENIFLNGTILGMKRWEIKQKLDEIVAFSGVEQFLDTPVKHYSSGMKVRLAFSVAAHLEPEILIIDEVLAVGDAEFQKKCLGKMEEVSKGQGRTVLFVSHNMEAIRSLCTRSLLLNKGSIEYIGEVQDAINQYIEGAASKVPDDLLNYPRENIDQLIFSELSFSKPEFFSGEQVSISFTIETVGGKSLFFENLDIGIAITDQADSTMIHATNEFIDQKIKFEGKSCQYQFSFNNILKPGHYYVTIFLRVGDSIQDWLRNVAVLAINESNPYGFPNTKKIQGKIFPNYEFRS